MKNLAIIAARSGSKRIPNKNTKQFHNKPIISYPISAAITAGCFDTVMVSTDSDLIANLAISIGASVPFLRSKETSSDDATTTDVVNEVLNRYSKIGIQFDRVCCIYATAAFITPKIILDCLNIFSDPNIDAVVPVCKFRPPIWRSFNIVNKNLNWIWGGLRSVKSQDLQDSYHDAGLCFWVTTKAFQETGQIIGRNTRPLIISSNYCQDIDNQEDWEIAELKFNQIIKCA
ncbi:pseudaminic acid cytidylyltransferase [Polynucleobacter sp. es-GGE-1]|uniref:pseudaminic acid cytidylyltransferase n=1 Tax=Polynucleobacter sp. es-GGE-1 TaxID=1819724 RepID=UPI001C0C6F35|nr:pseudaminic acid cytidylyltransferase [Polynucleobacter sp. es-GGE-1]MBU3635534.1 pseudaminic acid cytidylyltransferase [Polynucleobacter sp. es-GGE-1]